MPGNSNGPSPQPAAGLLLEQLQRQLTTDYSDLVTAYHHALQDTLFTNRSELRPAMLGQIAAAEAKVVVAFLEQPVPATATERGVLLCQLGLSESPLLVLGNATRQYVLRHLQNTAAFAALETIDAYYRAVIHGFLQTREKIILSEQERIRSA